MKIEFVARNNFKVQVTKFRIIGFNGQVSVYSVHCWFNMSNVTTLCDPDPAPGGRDGGRYNDFTSFISFNVWHFQLNKCTSFLKAETHQQLLWNYPLRFASKSVYSPDFKNSEISHTSNIHDSRPIHTLTNVKFKISVISLLNQILSDWCSSDSILRSPQFRLVSNRTVSLLYAGKQEVVAACWVNSTSSDTASA